MAMDSGSSSSDFSSDEDDDNYALEHSYEPLVTTTHVVDVEVLDEGDASSEDPLDSITQDATTLLDGLRGAAVPEELIFAVEAVLCPSDPSILYRYDAFTTALYYFSSLWPEDSASQRPLHKARAAVYRRFQAAFPLTPPMYSEYISDVDTIAQKHRLYELAMEDYWSVEVALQHLDLLDEHRDTMPGIFELVMERLLTSVGYHYTLGNDVWARCRELTAELYADKPESAKESAVRQLFVRQLRLPLEQNDLVMAEFRAWSQYNTLAGDDEAQRAVRGAEHQQQKVLGASVYKQLNQWEGKLHDEQAWLQYIKYVQKRVVPCLPQDDARRYVVCLMERGVAAVCLSTALWKGYTNFCTPTSKVSVCRRATRNVSFDSSVWVDWLVVVESAHGDATSVIESEVLARVAPPLMDAAHTARVLTTYCGVIRRGVGVQKLASTIAACRVFLELAFPTDKSALAAVLTVYANMLAFEVGRTNAVHVRDEWRGVWTEILQIRGAQADAWLAFYDEFRFVYARDCNLLGMLRSEVLVSALDHVVDYPVAILDKWLQLELASDDADLFAHVKKEYDAAVDKQQQQVAMQAGAQVGVPPLPASHQETPPAPAKKRKVESSEAATNKRPKTVDSSEKTERFTNANTLFVCNVAKEASADELRTVFGHITSLVDVRLIVKERGSHAKSRGMAYVQFNDEDGVAEGLKLNGRVVRGQAIKVERSEPPTGSSGMTAVTKPGKGPGTTSTTKPPQTTLYVGGLLPAEREPITDAEIEKALVEVLGSMDAIKRVLVLKDKRGRQKEYGLVELVDAALVKTAIAKQNQVQQRLGEQVTLQVSKLTIDQVVRHRDEQKQATALAKQEKTQGKTKTRPDAKAKAAPPAVMRKPPVAKPASLMPRTVRKKLVATSNANADEKKGDAEPVVPKSNEDFRKLFM